MEENFNIEIISPNKKILSSACSEVIIPAYEGLITILKDHIPLVTFLRPGFVEVKNKTENKIFFIAEGTVEFSENNLLILTTFAKNVKDITNEEVLKLISEAEKKLANQNQSDKEKYILSYQVETLKQISQ
tara:strand:- start:361 stop:753 length:393 start_codon:yes stop_codon:yes gene_type:complete